MWIEGRRWQHRRPALHPVLVARQWEGHQGGFGRQRPAQSGTPSLPLFEPLATVVLPSCSSCRHLSRITSSGFACTSGSPATNGIAGRGADTGARYSRLADLHVRQNTDFTERVAVPASRIQRSSASAILQLHADAMNVLDRPLDVRFSSNDDAATIIFDGPGDDFAGTGRCRRRSAAPAEMFHVPWRCAVAPVLVGVPAARRDEHAVTDEPVENLDRRREETTGVARRSQISDCIPAA